MAASSPGARRRKNVLILMADQHRPTALGAAGDAVARTPNLDALAGSGVRFESAYCTDPICVCSRASMLTGLYVHNHRTYGNDVPWPFENKTIAHHFGRAGYMTALVGKMHFVDAQRHGFDYNLDFNEWFQYLGPKAKIYADELSAPDHGSGMPQIESLWDAGNPWAAVQTPDGRKGINYAGRTSELAEDDHFESFVARESIRFLKEHGRRQPFLLITSFLKPHNPFMPAERFAGMFRAEDMRLPDTWGKVDRSKVPEYIRLALDHPSACPELADPKWAKVRMACYYASLAQMDDCLGRVLQTLRELGLEDDTIVLYTSDHGDMLGDHGLWQKFMLYEPSVGVPLIVRVPGLTAQNAICPTPVSLVQLAPTLLDLCGIPIPSGLDGQSMVRNLRAPTELMENVVFAENNLATRHASSMIRNGDYKYCYYLNDMPELYNLRLDPKEMNNLAIQPEFKAKVDEMKTQLFDWHNPSAGI